MLSKLILAWLAFNVLTVVILYYKRRLWSWAIDAFKNQNFPQLDRLLCNLWDRLVGRPYHR